jgi:hypothetical protein
MRQWQKIEIEERDLSDMLDELSPVVTGACRQGGWVRDWVLAGSWELAAWLEPVEYDQITYRKPGIYRMPVVLQSEANFEYVPQRRKYARK